MAVCARARLCYLLCIFALAKLVTFLYSHVEKKNSGEDFCLVKIPNFSNTGKCK